jgi:hypothetical protein
MLLSLLLRPLVGISHSGLREKVRDNDYYSRYPIALRDRRNSKERDIMTIIPCVFILIKKN